MSYPYTATLLQSGQVPPFSFRTSITLVSATHRRIQTWMRPHIPEPVPHCRQFTDCGQHTHRQRPRFSTIRQHSPTKTTVFESSRNRELQNRQPGHRLPTRNMHATGDGLAGRAVSKRVPLDGWTELVRVLWFAPASRLTASSTGASTAENRSKPIYPKTVPHGKFSEAALFVNGP